MAWAFVIKRWKPVSLNRLLRLHRVEQNKLLQSDKAVVAAEAHNAHTRHGNPVPKALGRRDVKLFFLGSDWETIQDCDNSLKGLFDGLVLAGLLVDDGFRFCRFGGAEAGVEGTFDKGRVDTQVVLTDIGDPLE